MSSSEEIKAKIVHDSTHHNARAGEAEATDLSSSPSWII